MQLNSTQNKIIAILFASGEPIEPERIAEALAIDKNTVEKLIAHIDDYLEQSGMPLQVLRLEGKLQLTTKEKYAQVIKNALEIKRNTPLSQAALEVLAIVAYNQPVTKSFVEQVRGVDSSGVISSLGEKGLVEEAGRLEMPGRPISYRTTSTFLRCFGLSSVNELPSVNGVEESQEEDSLQLDFDNAPA